MFVGSNTTKKDGYHMIHLTFVKNSHLTYSTFLFFYSSCRKSFQSGCVIFHGYDLMTAVIGHNVYLDG